MPTKIKKGPEQGAIKHEVIDPPLPRAKIIALINFKGGVGKTACALNIAGCLANQFKKRVLLIDLDVQASLSLCLMPPQQWANWTKYQKKTSYQIFLDIINGAHAWDVVTSTFRPEACPRLFLSPATFDMMELDIQLTHALNKPIHPKPFQCLDIQIKKIAGQFDYVILDCPPNMYMTTLNALYCADYALIPTIADFLSTAGLRRLVGFIEKRQGDFLLYDRSPVKIAGIVINKYDGRKIGMKETVEELERYVREKKPTDKVFTSNADVFSEKLRLLADVAMAPEQSLPVTIAYPKSHAAEDCVLLTHKIMEVLDGAD